jgi:hypothetical protein
VSGTLIALSDAFLFERAFRRALAVPTLRNRLFGSSATVLQWLPIDRPGKGHIPPVGFDGDGLTYRGRTSISRSDPRGRRMYERFNY